MANLFAVRRLIPSFRNRSAIFAGRILINEKKILIVNATVEFPGSGSIGLKTIIDMSPALGILSSAAFDDCYKQASDKLLAHFRCVADFIRVFDETFEWIHHKDTQFNLATAEGYNPIFIHGSRSKKEIKVEIFSRDSVNLNLGYETKSQEAIREGLKRISDVRDCFDEYQEALKDINIYDMMS